MNEQEVAVFKETLAVMARTSNETQIRAYVNAQFPRLPEAIQGEIMAALFSSALQEEAAKNRENDDAEAK